MCGLSRRRGGAGDPEHKRQTWMVEGLWKQFYDQVEQVVD